MPDFSHENLFGRRDGRLVVGIDEVGRGPLAGPVVACALLLPATGWPEGIRDSKQLTAGQRERLAHELLSCSIHGIGAASVAEIDALNILHASLLAMERALLKLAEALGRPPDHALVDGNRLPENSGCPATAIIGGDNKSLSIAAASIVAKVTRDRLMQELAQAHPHYGWERNAGYGTAAHLAGLARHGVCVHHRRSFAPVAARLATDTAA